MKVNRGIIHNIRASFQSGILSLDIKEGEKILTVYGDNGPTVRALAASFPGVIGPGQTVDRTAIIGKEIFWWYDDMGLCLGGIAPVNDETESALSEMLASGEVS